MTYCIRHEENKGSSSEINSTNSRLKIPWVRALKLRKNLKNI